MFIITNVWYRSFPCKKDNNQRFHVIKVDVKYPNVTIKVQIMKSSKASNWIFKAPQGVTIPSKERIAIINNILESAAKRYKKAA